MSGKCSARCFPPGYKVIALPDARAAIAYTPDLNITKHVAQNDRDAAVGVLSTEKGKTLVASVYCDIQKPFTTLSNVSHLARELKYPTLIATDSNAWSELWGPKENARGRELEEILIVKELEIETLKQSIPTFDNGRGSSFIDLTLSRGLSGLVKDWKVTRSEDSDRNYVWHHLDLVPEVREIQYWSETDWKRFKEYVKEKSKKSLPAEGVHDGKH